MYVENLQRNLEDSLIYRIKDVYELYFGCKVVDEDKPWILHICWVHVQVI
jgi:hypothetical protein